MIGDHAVLPDPELVVATWLADHDDVTDIVGDRISTQLRADWPCITFRRVGGVPVERHRLDEARIEVQCWGDPTESQADVSLLARTARAALHDLEGERVAGAFITGVTDDLPLTWLPDDSRDPTIPRYVFGVAIYLHP